MGVQQTGSDACAQAVEDDLRHEPLEEERSQPAFSLDLRTVPAQGIEVDDEARTQDAQHHHA